MVYKLSLLGAKIGLYVFSFGKPKVIGKENVKKINEGSAIICSNHKSAWDPVVLGAVFDNRELHFMAKKELFKKKFANNFLRKVNAFPIDRQGSDIGAIKHALKILKQGNVLGIFPEGKRNKGEGVLEFKDGLALLAHKSKAACVPVRILKEVKFFKRTTVIVGEPIYLDEFYDQKANETIFHEINEKIHGKVSELSNIEKLNGEN